MEEISEKGINFELIKRMAEEGKTIQDLLKIEEVLKDET